MISGFEKIDKNKTVFYQNLVAKIDHLIEGKDTPISALANAAALLKEECGFFWVGFYLAGDETLTLGPFQGPVACTSIELGRGVCGTSAKEKRTIRLDDVHKFEDHIACNDASKSELVIPGINSSGEVVFVLDVDEDRYGAFDEKDEKGLSDVVVLLVEKLGL